MNRIGFLVTGSIGIVTGLASQKLAVEEESELIRALRLTASFAFGSIVISPLVSRCLKGRVITISLRGAFYFGVAASVVQSGCHLFYFYLILYRDKAEGLKAIGETDTPTLTFFSKKLRDDEDIVRACIVKNPKALPQVSRRLLQDTKFIQSIVEELGQWQIWTFLDNTPTWVKGLYLDDEGIMRASILKNPIVWYKASQRILQDKAFTYELIREEPSVYEDAPKWVKNDYEFAMELLPNYPEVYSSLSKILRAREEVALEAEKAYQKSGFTLVNEVPQSLLENKNFMLSVVRLSGMSLRFASESLRRDYDLVLEAYRQVRSIYFLNLTSPEIREKLIAEVGPPKKHESIFGNLFGDRFNRLVDAFQNVFGGQNSEERAVKLNRDSEKGDHIERLQERVNDLGETSRADAAQLLLIDPSWSDKEKRSNMQFFLWWAHPDHGGTDELAKRVIAAKEILEERTEKDSSSFLFGGTTPIEGGVQ
ncbi:MAG: hypothetical protein K1060chlam2_01486 [Chlamydiae bacterium]|nr:hypothetical protein [Chlamydiota bacterium]